MSLRQFCLITRQGRRATFAALALAVPAAQAGESPTAIVELPTFEVRGEFPWMYAALPGYEVLSLARERESRSILERFARVIPVTALFIPPGWAPAPSESSTLFLNHFDSKSTLAAMQRAREYSFVPDNMSVVQGGVLVALPGESVTRDWIRGRRSALADHVSWTLLAQANATPPWYQRGLHALLADAIVAGRTVTVPGFGIRPGNIMPLQDVLAIGTDQKLAQIEQGPKETREEFIFGAALFVRWAFFSDDGRLRPSLLALVDQTARVPLSDELFSRHFGLTIEEAQGELDNYGHGSARSQVSAEIARESYVEVSADVKVEPATRNQVSRLLCRFYHLLGRVSFPNQRDEYFARARASLIEALTLGENDPRVVGELGYLNYSEGKLAEALPQLATAVAAGTDDPRQPYALGHTRLRLAAEEETKIENLSPEVFASVMDPMRRAMALDPPPKDAFVVSTALWSNRANLPPDEDLALLARGARIYHHVPQLIIPIIELHQRANRPEVARELIDLMLTLPNLTPEARAVLEAERAGLASAATQS